MAKFLFPPFSGMPLNAAAPASTPPKNGSASQNMSWRAMLRMDACSVLDHYRSTQRKIPRGRRPSTCSGAMPVFVDVKVSTINVSIDGLGAGLDAARTHGLKPVGLIAVDMFGLPADYDALERFARQYDLWLLPDAAQSFGASRGARKVGTLGTATATSFFPAKPLGYYGDGGAVFTNESDIAERIESIRLRGKARSGNKYKIERIGLNGRLDTIQAAILLQKLVIFEEEVQLRRDVARRYSEGLSDIIETPILPEGASPVWTQYTIRVPADRLPSIIAHLKAGGFPTAIYYPRPLFQQTAYRDFPGAVNGLPNS